MSAAGGVESLYPFLYSGGGSTVAELLEEVRRSTAEKATEIVELRQRVAAEYADRLAACAAGGSRPAATRARCPRR